MLVAQQACIVAGPKKCLKTSVLIDLGIALSIGGHFLGAFKVPEAVPVGLMLGESGMPVIQETIKRVCKAAEVDPHSVNQLFLTDRVPRLEDRAHTQAVANLSTEHSLDVLMIDPTYLAMSGKDAGNLFVQGEKLRGVSELCGKHGVTLILCHHNRKNVANTFDIPTLDDIAWSGFQEFARQWILLSRHEPYTPGTGEHRLWLLTGGSAGHSGAWGLDVFEATPENENGRVWETDLRSANDARAEKAKIRRDTNEMTKRTKHREQIEKAWNFISYKGSDGATQTAVAREIGVSHRAVKEIIGELLDSGSVEPCKVTVGNGQKRDGYQVVQGSQDQGELF